MAVILSEREKKQWNEIKTLAKNSNFFMLEDKDVVRMKRILDLLKNQGYIQDTDVGGTNIFLIVGNFQDFDDFILFILAEVRAELQISFYKMERVKEQEEIIKQGFRLPNFVFTRKELLHV